jgi:hypothetical protein
MVHDQPGEINKVSISGRLLLDALVTGRHSQADWPPGMKLPAGGLEGLQASGIMGLPEDLEAREICHGIAS